MLTQNLRNKSAWIKLLRLSHMEIWSSLSSF